MNINYVILLLAVIVYSAYCREWYVEPESALLNPGNANVKLCGRKKSSACSAKILSTIQGNLLPGDSLIFTGVRPANGGSPYVGTTYQMPDVVLTGLKGNTTHPIHIGMAEGYLPSFRLVKSEHVSIDDLFIKNVKQGAIAIVISGNKNIVMGYIAIKGTRKPLEILDTSVTITELVVDNEPTDAGAYCARFHRSKINIEVAKFGNCGKAGNYVEKLSGSTVVIKQLEPKAKPYSVARQNYAAFYSSEECSQHPSEATIYHPTDATVRYRLSCNSGEKTGTGFSCNCYTYVDKLTTDHGYGNPFTYWLSLKEEMKPHTVATTCILTKPKPFKVETTPAPGAVGNLALRFTSDGCY